VLVLTLKDMGFLHYFSSVGRRAFCGAKAFGLPPLLQRLCQNGFTHLTF